MIESVDKHTMEIVDDFLADNLHAECSCGWVGDLTTGRGDAQREWEAHRASSSAGEVPHAD